MHVVYRLMPLPRLTFTQTRLVLMLLHLSKRHAQLCTLVHLYILVLLCHACSNGSSLNPNKSRHQLPDINLDSQTWLLLLCFAAGHF
jgi:hypothetical protein